MPSTLREANQLLRSELQSKDREYRWIESTDSLLYMTLDLPMKTDKGIESEKAVVDTKFVGVNGKPIALAVKETQRVPLVVDPNDPTTMTPWNGFWVLSQLHTYTKMQWMDGTGSLDTYPLGGRQWYPVYVSGLTLVNIWGQKIPIPVHLPHVPTITETWDAIHLMRSTVEADDPSMSREAAYEREAKKEEAQKSELRDSLVDAAWVTNSPPGTRAGDGAVGLIDPRSAGYKDAKLGATPDAS